MPMATRDTDASAKQGASSQCIVSGAGYLVGILVTSSSGGTLKAWDNNSASGTIIFDTTAAITAPIFLPCPCKFSNGLYITVGGTIAYTVCYGII